MMVAWADDVCTCMVRTYRSVDSSGGVRCSNCGQPLPMRVVTLRSEPQDGQGFAFKTNKQRRPRSKHERRSEWWNR